MTCSATPTPERTHELEVERRRAEPCRDPDGGNGEIGVADALEQGEPLGIARRRRGAGRRSRAESEQAAHDGEARPHHTRSLVLQEARRLERRLAARTPA